MSVTSVYCHHNSQHNIYPISRGIFEVCYY